MTLGKGDLVYAISTYDPYDDGAPSTWRESSAVVAQSSDKQISLETYLPGIFRKRFDPGALGSFFFETPLQAIENFLARQRAEIASLDRRRMEAERAIVWAASQEGVAL